MLKKLLLTVTTLAVIACELPIEPVRLPDIEIKTMQSYIIEGAQYQSIAGSVKLYGMIESDCIALDPEKLGYSLAGYKVQAGTIVRNDALEYKARTNVAIIDGLVYINLKGLEVEGYDHIYFNITLRKD